jgi:hypothetical protein
MPETSNNYQMSPVKVVKLRFLAPSSETRVTDAPAQTLAELLLTLIGMVGIYLGLSFLDAINLLNQAATSVATRSSQFVKFKKIKIHKS